MTDSKNNTGVNNSGDRNSGNRNSGNWNSGNRNSGDRNSGNRNSGNRNSGYCNSGYCNSGDWNSGNRNSGSRNSGDSNSGDRNSGWFNTDEPMARFFNKNSAIKLSDFYSSSACPSWEGFDLCEWIGESEMTDEEKKADPQFFVRGGYLKTYTYQEAWSNFWKATSEENRKKFLNLPNFDSKIFLEITGIDVQRTTRTQLAKLKFSRR